MSISQNIPTYYKITRTFKVCGKVKEERVVGNGYYKTKKAAIDTAYKYIKKIEKYAETKYRVTLDEKYPLEAINGKEEGCSIHIRVEELSPEERETIAISKFMDFIKSRMKQ